MKRYRIKEHDPKHDIHFLQERFLWFFWRTITTASTDEIENFINEKEKGV